MFIQLFRDVGRRRADDGIEMLDLDALRARIGERAHRAPERPRDEVIVRTDGPRRSTPRTWRDIAGLSR
jgi:hypothetical protein